jgi:gluconolactonase
MIRLSRTGFLAATLLVVMAGHATAQKPKVPTLGTIQRMDKGLDAVLAEDAFVELLVADKFQWVEGPIWDKAHNRLLFSDTQTNTAWQWSATGGVKEFLKPSGYTGTAPFTGKEPGSNGMTMTKDGVLLMCQHGDRCVSKLVDGKFVHVADKYMGKRFNSPNDIIVKSNGDIYFSDPPYGLPLIEKDPAKELDFQGVFRVDPKGVVTLMTKEMTRPNGLAFSPDEKTLYVTNSDPDKSVVMAFPVKADGTLGEGKVFFDTNSAAKDPKKNPGLPDGMKVSQDGTVWATGPGGVYVLTPEGKELGLLATGVPTANCNWGDDGSTLYIAADKSLARIRTKAKGAGW